MSHGIDQMTLEQDEAFQQWQTDCKKGDVKSKYASLCQYLFGAAIEAVPTDPCKLILPNSPPV